MADTVDLNRVVVYQMRISEQQWAEELRACARTCLQSWTVAFKLGEQERRDNRSGTMEGQCMVGPGGLEDCQLERMSWKDRKC